MKKARERRTTTLAKRNTKVRENRLRDVAHLISKGCTCRQIADKFNTSVQTAQIDIDTVIEQWTERNYEEPGLVEIASNRQDGLGLTAIEDYAKSKEEVTVTSEQCETCDGKGDLGGFGECKDCEGEGMVEVRKVVHTAKGNPQLLKIAADCFDRSARYRGLLIQRKELREDQAAQVTEQHDHKHIHIEQGPYHSEPSEALIAVQTIMEKILKGEAEPGILEGEVMKGKETEELET